LVLESTVAGGTPPGPSWQMQPSLLPPSNAPRRRAKRRSAGGEPFRLCRVACGPNSGAGGVSPKKSRTACRTCRPNGFFSSDVTYGPLRRHSPRARPEDRARDQALTSKSFIAANRSESLAGPLAREIRCAAVRGCRPTPSLGQIHTIPASHAIDGKNASNRA